MKTSPEITEPLTPPAECDAPSPAEGWAWLLPAGPGCAREARRVVARALGAFGVCDDRAADAQLMVSELATNAYQHTCGQGPYELWLYPHERAEGARELRCAVFDGEHDTHLPGYSWTSGDFGRGLSIVRELSGGRWGMCRGRSRFGDLPSGKAVWFAVPGAPLGDPLPDIADDT